MISAPQDDVPRPSGTVHAYDAIADEWDRPGSLGFRSPQFAARMRRLIVDMLQPAAGGRVALDLGAGTGWMLDATAPLFEQLIAIEHSAAMVDACRRRIRQLGLERVRAETGDAMSLDGIADGSVDAIYAVGLLDAVPDPARVLLACARVLKPGGLVVLSTSNGACPWYWLRDRVLGKADVRTGRYLTCCELVEGARGAGLSVAELRTWGAAPPRLVSAPAVAVLDALERLATRMGLSRYLGVLSGSFRKV